MKILFVLENYIPHIGGVEIVFKILAEGLVKKGHQVEIVTHRIKGTKKFEEINGVKIYRIKSLGSRHVFTFTSIPEVIKRSKDCDIIHTTTYNGAFPAKIASIMNKKPVIITVHEVLGKLWESTGVGFFQSTILRFLEFLIIKLNFDYYLTVSNSTRQQVLNCNVEENKVQTVYNGVDYRLWNPKKNNIGLRKKLNLQDNFVILFYGRPGISKGLEFLIKALPIVFSKIPTANFFGIVSKDKAYSSRYKYILRLVNKLGIKDKCIFNDPVKYVDLPNYISMANCVVVPSLTEGFGFTAAESCAMNKIVVASNTTSLPEVVSGKYTLVEPGNPEAIANGIINAYNNKYEKSKKKFFLIRDNINKYEDIYTKILQ